ncbi:protein hook [Anaeramoeba flamelloides]|uniref:Protein hook n=1 Tax=Anaeramoeba flamelloides TaxID=1746091 RepID=A0AAV7Y7F8_9EUKA|nr:protein hook [Anaeramoeba flamelloides]
MNKEEDSSLISWVNLLSNNKIEDLTDLQDGIILGRIITKIINKSIELPNQKVNNWNDCFENLKLITTMLEDYYKKTLSIKIDLRNSINLSKGFKEQNRIMKLLNEIQQNNINNDPNNDINLKSSQFFQILEQNRIYKNRINELEKNYEDLLEKNQNFILIKKKNELKQRQLIDQIDEYKKEVEHVKDQLIRSKKNKQELQEHYEESLEPFVEVVEKNNKELLEQEKKIKELKRENQQLMDEVDIRKENEIELIKTKKLLTKYKKKLTRVLESSNENLLENENKIEFYNDYYYNNNSNDNNKNEFNQNQLFNKLQKRKRKCLELQDALDTLINKKIAFEEMIDNLKQKNLKNEEKITKYFEEKEILREQKSQKELKNKELNEQLLELRDYIKNLELLKTNNNKLNIINNSQNIINNNDNTNNNNDNDSMFTNKPEFIKLKIENEILNNNILKSDQIEKQYRILKEKNILLNNEKNLILEKHRTLTIKSKKQKRQLENQVGMLEVMQEMKEREINNLKRKLNNSRNEIEMLQNKRENKDTNSNVFSNNNTYNITNNNNQNNHFNNNKSMIGNITLLSDKEKIILLQKEKWVLQNTIKQYEKVHENDEILDHNLNDDLEKKIIQQQILLKRLRQEIDKKNIDQEQFQNLKEENLKLKEIIRRELQPNNELMKKGNGNDEKKYPGGWKFDEEHFSKLLKLFNELKKEKIKSDEYIQIIDETLIRVINENSQFEKKFSENNNQIQDFKNYINIYSLENKLITSVFYDITNQIHQLKNNNKNKELQRINTSKIFDNKGSWMQKLRGNVIQNNFI